MGRELKRVPLNFSWPIGELWCGYINPHKCHECKDCDGLGWSKEYEQLKDKWYNFGGINRKANPFRQGGTYDADAWCNNLSQADVDALVEAGRLWDFTRIPITDEQEKIVREKIEDGGNSWLPFDNGYRPTAEEVNEWSLKTMGHDSINCSVVIKAELARNGKSHLCPACGGSGENWQSEKAKELYEGWENYDPPSGDGFQLWTTTSEGSPMTPVFETLELLCEYCEKESISVFGSRTATKEKWMEMLSEDFVHHKEGNMIFV